MENPLLTAENVLCHLRKIRPNKKYLKIFKLFENVEKHCYENKVQQCRILDEILQILIGESAKTLISSDDTIVFECVVWLTYLQEKQELPCCNESQFSNLLRWLLNQQKCKKNLDVECKIFFALGCLFALHPTNGDKYFVLVIDVLLNYISCSTDIVLLITALQCMDKVFSSLKDVKLSEEQCAITSEAGLKLLQVHYMDSKVIADSFNLSAVILYTIQILLKIVALNTNFLKMEVGELLGVAKAYFHFGIVASQTSIIKPQKVCMSQQALYDSAEEVETLINSENARSCGGKTSKSRKPRTVTKSIRSNDSQIYNSSSEHSSSPLLFDMKTSDSDASEPENDSNRTLFERSKKAKIRLAAINLVGAISRILERKTLFGYWHALFPNGTAQSNDNLLYIAQYDPNLKCRSAALQVCANLFYGSKGFLHQAEINIKRCPTTFIPFSVSLGFTVLAIFEALTTILSSESSLPVLTQALKCLAVLVQATPFQQFKKGYVQNLVTNVKPFVYHHDAAIQVSALMVMEFLIAMPDPTDDIAEAVGLPQEVTLKQQSKHKHMGDEQVDIVEIKEFDEFEKDICEKQNDDETTFEDYRFPRNIEDKSSWLLRCVFNNLTKQERMVATSVRIESLQVLIVMSSHFVMIKPHLQRVFDVLQHSLNDVLPDVRLYAARCIDACAYQISRYLSDDTRCSDDVIHECKKFWLNMMPIILANIGRDNKEMTTVRITLCDALSNIGVLMFEHTSHSTQICLISFLSGVSSDTSEETVVRAAAARALAVFALYPSLRGDLVFIENTAELTLSLVQDSNLQVRVKSCWSLGNLSDALIGRGIETAHQRQERISDDLLFRLITAATTASNDNDKVRCNAVRTLGNLLQLLTEEHFNSESKILNWRQIFSKSICKLTDCIRSSGNAKVKWNTCYAISNLMKHSTIFKVTDLDWQEILFPALCHVIVHHSNFKVRINASAAIINVTERSYFGTFYEMFWSSVLEAMEQSYNLDNFHEYNHRDNLQEQLCLAVSHIIKVGNNDDLPMLKKHLLPRVEIINSTWKRVINRMVPEKAAPLLTCPVVLLERGKLHKTLLMEQKKALDFLLETFNTE